MGTVVISAHPLTTLECFIESCLLSVCVSSLHKECVCVCVGLCDGGDPGDSGSLCHLPWHRSDFFIMLSVCYVFVCKCVAQMC